jgi:hypothetical protein
VTGVRKIDNVHNVHNACSGQRDKRCAQLRCSGQRDPYPRSGDEENVLQNVFARSFRTCSISWCTMQVGLASWCIAATTYLYCCTVQCIQ